MLSVPFTQAVEFDVDNVHVDAGSTAYEDIDRLRLILYRSIQFVQNELKWHSDSPFTIYVVPSVNYLKRKFGVEWWIGAFYTGDASFIQPISSLIKTNTLESVIFIEYLHHVIDQYTSGTCPDWLNEGISIYYSRIFTGRNLVVKDGCTPFTNYHDFIDLKKHMQSREQFKRFADIFILFSDFCRINYNFDIQTSMLHNLHKGISPSDLSRKITGETLEQLYKEFVTSNENNR